MKFEFKSKFNNFIYLLLTLLFVCTAVNVGLNFADSGDSDLSNIAVAADQPTNTNYYWTDTEAQTEQGVDFTNYTLSGSGSEEAPYLIQSETDLAFLSWTIYTGNAYNNHVSSSYYYSDIYFKQTKNLDLSAYYWQPIGIAYTRDVRYASRYFSGNYDGDGHTVSGIFTPAGTGDGYSYQGLFGHVLDLSSTNKATIQNIGVIDSFIQGEYHIGGVVGWAYSVTITNCYNTGSVSGTGGSVGGVVGSGSVTNCYNTGAVSGTGSSVGGVVGSGSATNCYNTGSVSGTRSSVGGVVGSVYDVGSTITNCYNTGSVSGTGNYVGGVVGSAGGTKNSTITNCYNTGSVSGSRYVGGVVGRASSATITSTYYGGDCEASIGGIDGADVDGQAEYLADLETLAKNEEWYLNSSNWDSSYPWDFENTWELSLVPDYMLGYPTLQGMSLIISAETIFWTDSDVQTEFGVDFTNYTLSGSGAPADPYLIQSETDLAFLSWTIYNDQVYGGSDNKYTSGSNNYFYSDICFKQTKNLDLSAYYWQPIGIYYTRSGATTQRYFSGNYDGGGYTVSGVFTPAGSSDGYSYQGLFGRVYGRNSTLRASIANLGVIDSFVQGYSYVGGVVGYENSNATISNVYNTGIVSGSSRVGGVVGFASYATISNAYNTGSVSGSYDVGGVVGYTYSTTVRNAYNTGLVSGDSQVGGVVGRALGSATISDCGVECAVITGTSNVGIFVGQNASSSAKIENCYAIVDGDLSPYGSNSGTVTNCLWITGGVKYYLGTDFSGFAWLNTDSCPIPKGLSWMGQFWTEDITSQITSSSDWTEWVA